MVAASWTRRTVVTKKEHDALGQLRRYRCPCFFFLVVLSYDDWTKEKTRLAILGLISLARIRQENVVL